MTRIACSILLAAFLAGCATAAPSQAPPTSTPLPVPASPAPTTAPSPAPSSDVAVRPGERWIAYQGGEGGGKYGIRLIRVDGTGMHALAPQIAGDYQLHPDWSPDGTQIVFAEVDDPHIELWLADVATGDVRRIVACADQCTQVDEPAFSPDGRRIAFHRQAVVDGKVESTLELFDIATATISVILTARSDRVFFAPRWAPDSRHLVLENVHRTSSTSVENIDAGQLVVVDTQVRKPEPEVITEPDYWPGNPEWSPDGRTILFFRPEPGGTFDGPCDIWTIQPDGTGLARLTHIAALGGQAIHPAWFPDGSRIIFTASSDDIGDVRIVTIAADGSDLQPAATGGLSGLHPRVRPTP